MARGKAPPDGQHSPLEVGAKEDGLKVHTQAQQQRRRTATQALTQTLAATQEETVKCQKASQ